MEEAVTIKPSSQQLLALVAIYLVIAAAVVAVIPGIELLFAGTGLTLFMVSDIRRLLRGQLELHIKGDGSITVSHLDDETCYPESRMYYNRWCMVMKLKNSHGSRCILLTPDRFTDEQSYARARHRLMQLGKFNHAA